MILRRLITIDAWTKKSGDEIKEFETVGSTFIIYLKKN